MNKPNFIIAGVARCGTTSLYHYLKQHPDIDFPKIKEPKFFSAKGINFPHTGPGDETVDAKIVTSEAEYFKLFDDLSKAKVIGEASSDYFYYHKHSIPEIKAALGDVKIILCFRNPIERAYSAYSNLIRDSRETLSFSEAIKIEEKRLLENYDWMWAYKGGSLYSAGLRSFLENFSNVKVIFLEELESNPLSVLKEVCHFLDVDTSAIIDVSTKYSHSGKPKNKLVAMLTNRNNKVFYSLREFVLKLIPRSFAEKIASKLFKKSEIDFQTRQILMDYFKDDINELEEMLGKKMTLWK